MSLNCTHFSHISKLPNLQISLQNLTTTSTNKELLENILKSWLPDLSSHLHRCSDGRWAFQEADKTLSLSHKDFILALAVLHQKSPCGIDLEYLNSTTNWHSFVGRFFNPLDILEILRLKSISSWSLSQCYTIAFSCKEAALKATHLQIDPLNLSLQNISLCSTTAGTFTLSSSEQEEKKTPFKIHFEVQDHYILSVCY